MFWCRLPAAHAGGCMFETLGVLAPPCRYGVQTGLGIWSKHAVAAVKGAVNVPSTTSYTCVAPANRWTEDRGVLTVSVMRAA
jgi:hypothetical protein